MNNQYFRNIAGRPDWFFDDDVCTKVGDAWGNKGPAVWIAKMNQNFRTGAPVQFIQKKVVCPNCADQSYDRGGRHADRLAQDRDCCLNNVPNGAQCRPDGHGPVGSVVTGRDDDFSDGCEYSHFIFGKDETALSVDMGLMWNFNVDRYGFPSGCPGLATFYPSANRFSDWTCGIDGRPWFDDASLSFDDPNLTRTTTNDWTSRGCPMDCPVQDYQYPGDGATLAAHVERFADDQAAWIEEFIPAMEKLVANGYSADALVVSWPTWQLHAPPPPSPAPVSSPLPPSQSPAVEATVTTSFVASGEPSDYSSTDRVSIRRMFANEMGVDVSAVTLTIAAASVLITAEITLPSTAAAMTAVSALNMGIMANASALTTALDTQASVSVSVASITSPALASPLPSSSSSDGASSAVMAGIAGGVAAFVVALLGCSVHRYCRGRRRCEIVSSTDHGTDKVLQGKQVKGSGKPVASL